MSCAFVRMSVCACSCIQMPVLPFFSGIAPIQRLQSRLSVLRGPYGLGLWGEVSRGLETLLRGGVPDHPRLWSHVDTFVPESDD
jgi:hypothetical protein